MALTFSSLMENYPTATRQELFHVLGGEWPRYIDNADYQNTCAVRLSVALKGAGMSIPSSYKEAIDGRGSPLILKVSTMKKALDAIIGESYWGMSKEPGQPLGKLPTVTGIIAYHFAWGQARGHFDLWNRNNFIGMGNLEDVKDGFAIELWAVP